MDVRAYLDEAALGFARDPADSDYQRGYQAAIEELRVRVPPKVSPDIVRVLRILEYVGPRDLVEDQIAKSIHGTREFGLGGACRITAATIGTFPEILKEKDDAK